MVRRGESSADEWRKDQIRGLPREESSLQKFNQTYKREVLHLRTALETQIHREMGPITRKGKELARNDTIWHSIYMYIFPLRLNTGGVRFSGRKGGMPAWFSTEFDNYI